MQQLRCPIANRWIFTIGGAHLHVFFPQNRSNDIVTFKSYDVDNYEISTEY